MPGENNISLHELIDLAENSELNLEVMMKYYDGYNSCYSSRLIRIHNISIIDGVVTYTLANLKHEFVDQTVYAEDFKTLGLMDSIGLNKWLERVTPRSYVKCISDKTFCTCAGCRRTRNKYKFPLNESKLCYQCA